MFLGVLNNMQQPSPLVSSGASGYSTASGRGYAEVTMIPVATAGPCYKECDMILPFMVSTFRRIWNTLRVFISICPQHCERNSCHNVKTFLLPSGFLAQIVTHM